MVFTEEQLQMSVNPFTILDEAVYLTEQETTILPQMVPIVENSRLQAYIIDFNGIRQLSESTGLDYIDSIVLVSEQEGIDPSQVCIAIDEADIIESPELANLGPIVVRPLSELDDEFQFCLEAVNAFMDTEDEAFLDLLSEADVETSKPSKIFHKIKGGKGERIKKSEYLYRKDMDNLTKIWRKHSDRNDQIPIDAPVPSYEKFHLTNAARYRLHRYLEKKHNRLGDIYGLGAILNADAADSEYQYHYDTYRDERRKRRAREEAEAKKSSTSSGGNTLPTPKTTSSGGNTAPNPNNSSMSFGKKAAMGAGIAAAVGGGILAYKHYRDKPKSVIAKRIAALRSIYQKFLHNAQSNPEKAGIFKRMAAKILGVIDKLLSFLQRKADGK